MTRIVLDAELVPLLAAIPAFSFTADTLPTMRTGAPPAAPTGTDPVACADHVVSDHPLVVEPK